MIEKQTGKAGPAELPLVHEPGEKWTYGASTKVLGDVVEKLSGQGIGAFVRAGSSARLG